jgi:hypothetical protein
MAEAERRGMTTSSNADNPTERDGSGTTIVDEDTSQEDALFQRREGEQPSTLNDDGLTWMIKDGYLKDKLFKLILDRPKDYNAFYIWEEIIWTVNPRGDEVVCVPCNCKLIMQLIDQAHAILGHFGDQQTAEYLCFWY